MEKKRVGIIGAGVSGLAACKHATDKGFRPVVFEAEPTIGGVWGRTIESTKLQAPASAYRFSDHPWPRNVTETYPNHEQVMEYILSYARQFGLFQHIKFDSKVVGIEFVGPSEEEIMRWESWAGNGEAFGCGDTKGTWLITTQNMNRGDSMQIFEVDFVILCVGRFSGVPNVPKFPAENGPEVFEGRVLHSMDYSSMSNADAAELIRGKRVVVVGSGKSAYDIAAECAKANGVECPCTMIYRTKHWFVHDNNVWGINLSHFYLTRFAELLIHKPGEGFLRGLFATLLFPVRWAISRIIEAYYTRKIPMEKHDMVPEYSFFHAMSSCSIAMLPEGFYSRVDEGSIVLKKSKTIRFSDQRGVILDGEDAPPTIEADVVILATGFRGDQKLRDIFVSPWLQKIVAGPSNRTVPLYRECIHPRIPQLAIIGYSESLTNIYAAETMSRWVSHFLGGRFRLPSVRCMEEEVAEWEKYKKRYNMKYFRRSCVSTVNIWYNDMLCRDMGCDRKRKKGWFAEWFEPYGPADYAGLR